MDLKTQLSNALHTAMRSGDDAQKRTIRMLLSAIKLEEVSRGKPLDDPAIIPLVQKEIKLRREAIEFANQGGRADLAAENQEEISILEGFLPSQMGEEELRTTIVGVIAEVGASNPADMGKVMKVLLPRLQGRAPNDQVSRIVKEMLAASS